jgi:hypothetical protein
MSKEQTPITVEGFDRVIRQINAVNTSQDQWDVRKQKIDILKEFTQSKVIEALEEEVPEAFRQGRIEESNRMEIPDYKKIRSTKYYETEVKPKYQNKDENN